MSAGHGHHDDGAAPARWEPSRLVTLLTDFGVRDPYVGIMKGVLWSHAPSLRAVIDLTHDVPPQDVERAAFHLVHAWSWFPPGTVHVVVVDPGVGTGREMLAVEVAGHVVLAPDNGIVGPLCARAPEARVRRVDPARWPTLGGSHTFHGRDRFAPAAAWLAEGGEPAGLGEPIATFLRLAEERAVPHADGSVEGRILFADRFGNLVTNLAGEPAGGEGEAREVAFAGAVARLVRTYGEGGPGEVVALVNSYGLVELAVRDGSAEALTGLGRGATVRLRHRP